LRLIVSNTTEAGFKLEESDRSDDSPPRSFPAKLLQVLHARFEAGHPGPTILPCELVDNNSDELLFLVMAQAEKWEWLADTGFRSWLEADCGWCNTLVDRIVSAPSPGDPLAEQDPLYAVAEPYASWLIEDSVDLGGLAEHPAVRVVDALRPYALRKVRVLNGAHTALVAKALPLGFGTVREAVADERIRAWLEELLFTEIVPSIADRAPGAEPFAHDVLERFANPFLDHRLSDIALHQELKVKTRLWPTIEEHRERFGATPPLLAEILGDRLP
jgi:tagaturonate reductase